MPRTEVFDRDEVLKQAVDLFWKKGYNATSMQDLTEATGLNRSSIYNSFGSKMELYQLALRRYQRDSGVLFQNALMNAANPRDAIQRIFDGLMQDIMSDSEGKGCFNLNCKAEMSQEDKDIKAWLQRTQENTITAFEGLIVDGQNRGLINRRQTAYEYAFYLFNAFQGMRMTGILMRDREILRAIVDSTLKILY